MGTDWVVLGRRNKNRGKSWEKRFARRMGWEWVGSIRHTLQEGDVVDDFWGRGGFWIAECKTQPRGPSSNISIKADWIQQMQRDSLRTKRHGLLAIHLTGLQKDHVFLPAESFAFLNTACDRTLKPDAQWTTRARGRGWGFVVQRSLLDGSEWELAELSVLRSNPADPVGRNEEQRWWIMRDVHFRALLLEHGLMGERD